MSNTNPTIIPEYLQELLGNSRAILEHNIKMQQEIVSLRFTVDRQAGEISALSATVKETRTPVLELNQDDTMLSRKEAAKRLDSDLSTLWRWENSRQLIPTRIGGKIYYSKKLIDDLLFQRKASSKAGG